MRPATAIDTAPTELEHDREPFEAIRQLREMGPALMAIGPAIGCSWLERDDGTDAVDALWSDIATAADDDDRQRRLEATLRGVAMMVARGEVAVGYALEATRLQRVALACECEAADLRGWLLESIEAAEDRLARSRRTAA